MFLQQNIVVNNSNDSLMYQLWPGLHDVDLGMDYLCSLPHTLSLNIVPVSKGLFGVLAPK